MPLGPDYHKKWMQDTYSLTKARSEELKKIDKFILAGNKFETHKALTAWIDGQIKKGQDWHRSVRNLKNKAVERLATEVGYMEKAAKDLSPVEKQADAQAKAVVMGQIRRASQQMFAGRRVVFSNVFYQAINERRIKGNQKLKNSGGKIGKATAFGTDLGGAVGGISQLEINRFTASGWYREHS